MEFSRPEYWEGIPFSRGSSQPRDGTQASHIADGFSTSWDTREAQKVSLKTAFSIQIYVWLSPFTVHLKLSQRLLISYIPTQNKKLKKK